MKPRVAFDARTLQSGRRGVGVYTWNLLNALANKPADFQICLLLDRALPELGGEFPRFERIRIGGAGGQVAWEQFFLPMNLRGFDLLHSPANAAPVLSPCPVVVTLHDAIFVRKLKDISQVTYPRQVLGHLYRRNIYPLAARRARGIITVSESARAEIESLIGIPAGAMTVTTEALSEPFSREQAFSREEIAGRFGLAGPYLLAMGAYEKRKNVSLLFEVLEILKTRSGSPPCLALAGAENLHATRYREEVKARGVADLVRFLPFVDERGLKSLHTWADAFLWPSRREGFGLPALEAMSCDTPVLASDIAVNREIIADAGILIGPDDASGWADAIAKLVADPAFRQDLCARGRRRVGEFSWDRAAELTLSVYRRALVR